MLRQVASVVLLLSVSGVSLGQTLGERIEQAVEAAIQKEEFPGAVVLVLRRGEVLHRAAYGHRRVKPETVPMTPDTIFDLASLTKPVATAGSVFRLVEQGKLKLSDRVSQHWPEFKQNGKEAVTVEQCLIHTSGLTADNAASDYADGPKLAFERIAALKLLDPPGTKFRYSDVGFLVLGHLVTKLSGRPLDEFARREIFQPLKMLDTGYQPAKELHARIAPTGNRQGQPIVGVVHDPRAYGLGGVAGHAGLFGTADDLAKFAKMLLNHGELDGTRIFRPETVKLYTEAVPVPGGQRSRGWDVDTAYSGPRGDYLKKGTNFGHTGFTGTSLWIDPPSQTVIIILTSRLHPHDRGNASPIRKAIANIVTASQ